MANKFQIAADFVEKVKKTGYIKDILQIVLFGSVAKGEDKAASDIDIAVIHSLEKHDGLKSALNKLADKKIQTVFLNIKKLPKETELVSALTGEGILLYGKPIKIVFEKKEIMPRILIVYDTTELDRKSRMLLNRALHGSVSRNVYKGKEYKTETKGMLIEKGYEKISKSTVLCDPRKAPRLKGLLKRFNAKVKERLIWVM